MEETSQNKKVQLLAVGAGLFMIFAGFWIVFDKQRENAEVTENQEAAPITITSLEDLPPGIPPPPPPPDFDKTQFHIPGVTDGIATPTPQQ